MAGNTAPLPVKGSVSVAAAGAIEVVVVGMVLPCGTTVDTVAGRVVDVDFTVVGDTSIDVVVELDVAVVADTSIDVVVAAAVVVVGIACVTGGAIVVVVAVVVVAQ